MTAWGRKPFGGEETFTSNGQASDGAWGDDEVDRDGLSIKTGGDVMLSMDWE